MIKPLAVGLLTAVAVAPLVQQDPGVATLVATTMSANKKFIPPLCPIKASGKVGEGGDWLRAAVEASDAAKRSSALDEGTTALNRAINQEHQDRNAAAWYYMGRIQLMKGDVVGADSSFTKAEKLEPKCELDIDSYRARAWEALANNASGLRKQGKNDAALIYLHAADQIYRSNAYAPISIGEIHSVAGQHDSALAYFKRARAIPAQDSASTSLHDLATFDYGVTAIELKQYPEAITALNEFVKAQPNDAQGARALSRAYEGAGKADSAKIWSDKAVALGGANAAAAADVNPADPTALNPLFDQGVAQFNDKNYQAAAATFSSILDKSPYYRDALFNLANCHLGLKNGPELVKAANRLVAIEPLNDVDYTLLGRGYQLSSDNAGAIKAVEKREALPVSIQVTGFRIKAESAILSGKVTGREPKDLAGTALKVPVPAIVVEYLDGTGNAVTTQDVVLPTVAEGATQEFSAEGKGKGIVAWRYHTK